MVRPLDETIILFGEGRIAKNTGVVTRIDPDQATRDHTRLVVTGVVFGPGLSRGNRPGDTERDSGKGNQHLLPAHDDLQRLSHWRRREADISLLPDRDQ
jgi:hypothetical protein